MNSLSKLCDGADWFKPEVLDIIVRELRERPYFHRKQWEFAMIFHVLREYGKLDRDSVGLSMGGGKERLLYSIANHVRQLVVTDLYDTDTTWDCAKTDDPKAYILREKPFDIDPVRLQVLRMDMRELEFPDRSFDFCYSSCAVEHIGAHEDFLRHFDEVARVLKDGGLYVFTTEFHYGPEVIRDENNYVFSAEYLSDLLAASRLAPCQECDARILRHQVNLPLPANFGETAFIGSDVFQRRMFRSVPHVQLLRGRHPLTSVLLIAKKRTQADRIPLRFVGLEESRRLMNEGVNDFRIEIERGRVDWNPFSFMADGKSRFFADHSEFFDRLRAHADGDTVFHTQYCWLGSGEKILEVAIEPTADSGSWEIDVRIHRYKTLDSAAVECVMNRSMTSNDSCIRVPFTSDLEYCYAILAKRLRGSPVLKTVAVSSFGKRTEASASGTEKFAHIVQV